MHHAYPRDCPWPHEVGTTSPQTPNEWMEQNGERDSQASAEEMAKVVANDSCVVVGGSGPKIGSCGASALPWNMKEELLGPHHHFNQSDRSQAPDQSDRSQAPDQSEYSLASDHSEWSQAHDQSEWSQGPEPGTTPASTCFRDIAISCTLMLVLLADALVGKARPRSGASGRAEFIGKTTQQEGSPEGGGQGARANHWRTWAALMAVAFALHAFNLLPAMAFACTLLAGFAAVARQFIMAMSVSSGEKPLGANGRDAADIYS